MKKEQLLIYFVPKLPFEAERTDVSTVAKEALDRDQEVVYPDADENVVYPDAYNENWARRNVGALSLQQMASERIVSMNASKCRKANMIDRVHIRYLILESDTRKVW